MSHTLLGDTRLYVLLLGIDGDLRDEVRAGKCPECGGALHVADFPRKPRGSPEKLPEGYEKRFSLCCSREGCRARATPTPAARRQSSRQLESSLLAWVGATSPLLYDALEKLVRLFLEHLYHAVERRP